MRLYDNVAGTAIITSTLSPGGTSVTVNDGSVFQIPRTDEDLTVLVLVDPDDATSFEVVWMTTRSGNTLTIERGKEGTTDATWVVGTLVECRHTAGIQTNVDDQWGTPLVPPLFSGINHKIRLALSPLRKARYMSGIVDLADAPDWVASTSYNRGDVVRPTSKNSRQYWLWFPYGQAITSITSEGSEPTWPTSLGSTVAANAGATAFWVCEQDNDVTLTRNLANGEFVPTEVGFICHSEASPTVQPALSFGRSGANTQYVNNQTLSITDSLMIHRFTSLASTVGRANMNVTVDTVATATHMRGRFYWEGYHMELF